MTSPANKWTIACGIDAHYLLDEHQQVVCDLHSIRPDHVRRIVACVNACQGIPTEILECADRIQYAADRIQYAKDVLAAEGYLVTDPHEDP